MRGECDEKEHRRARGRRSKAEIEEAVKFAEESPELADEHLAEFTYKE